MRTYTPKEASELLEIPLRTIQYRCRKQNIRKKNNQYLITEKHIEEWKPTQQNAKENAIAQSQLYYEEFTEQQYEKLQEVIEQYPLQLKDIEYLQESVESYRSQIEYLKKSLDKRDELMAKILDQLKDNTKIISQQNFITAKEKGFDN